MRPRPGWWCVGAAQDAPSTDRGVCTPWCAQGEVLDVELAAGHIQVRHGAEQAELARWQAFEMVTLTTCARGGSAVGDAHLGGRTLHIPETCALARDQAEIGTTASSVVSTPENGAAPAIEHRAGGQPRRRQLAAGEGDVRKHWRVGGEEVVAARGGRRSPPASISGVEVELQLGRGHRRVVEGHAGPRWTPPGDSQRGRVGIALALRGDGVWSGGLLHGLIACGSSVYWERRNGQRNGPDTCASAGVGALSQPGPFCSRESRRDTNGGATGVLLAADRARTTLRVRLHLLQHSLGPAVVRRMSAPARRISPRTPRWLVPAARSSGHERVKPASKARRCRRRTPRAAAAGCREPHHAARRARRGGDESLVNGTNREGTCRAIAEPAGG